MASSKEIPSRSLAHRPSLSSSHTPSSLPSRHSRTSSQSLLGNALNANHRVTRRKSMTNTAANAAAVVAAIQEADDKATALPILGARRNTMSKHGVSRAAIASGLPSPPSSLPSHKFASVGAKMGSVHDSAIDDDSNEMSDGDNTLNVAKGRARRASDGQPLSGKDGRKSSRAELRCDQCGKGYKHSSCLTKHLWEHTPEWSYTSKLLISKHQQVQLLEAASVLVAMNTTSGSEDVNTPPDSTQDFHSERDSASPAASASAYSEREAHGSADTTPPPQLESAGQAFSSFAKRHSSGSAFGRSYQSAPSVDSIAGSVPGAGGFGFNHFRHGSQDQRPMSSGRNATSQDDRELASAVEGLSCSFGSNSGRTVLLPSDAPPVPPLPAQYLDQAAWTGTSFINSFPSRAPESFTRGEVRREREDVKMEDSGDSTGMEDNDDEDMVSRARSDEDDDGVFGRMEE